MRAAAGLALLLVAARARPAGARVRRGRGRHAEQRATPRSGATAACSSSRCSGRTSTSARVYLGYARQSPRERPQGYSTTAPPAADRLARRAARALVRARDGAAGARRRASSPCTAGSTRQSGFFAPGCAARPRRRCGAPAGACSPATASSPPGGRLARPDVRWAADGTREARDRLPGGDPQRERLRRRDETPLQEAPLLSERLGNRLFLKREDLQPVFSFKLRGAYNKMSRLSGRRAPARRRRRVGRQPRAGRRARGAAARRRGDDRDAGDDAADQDRLRRGARRHRRARGRLVRRRLRRGDAHHAASAS